MLPTFLSRTAWFVLLCLLQALVFNHVHIAGVATPMPYVFFLLVLRSDTPHWVYVACGFLMGLAIDLFTGTPGMAAASLCLTGLLAPWLLRAFTRSDGDADEAFAPSAKTMKWGGFMGYAASLVLVNCIGFFLIETFSFFNWMYLLLATGSSAALSLCFIVAIELIRTRDKQDDRKRKRGA